MRLIPSLLLAIGTAAAGADCQEAEKLKADIAVLEAKLKLAETQRDQNIAAAEGWNALAQKLIPEWIEKLSKAQILAEAARQASAQVQAAEARRKSLDPKVDPPKPAANAK